MSFRNWYILPSTRLNLEPLRIIQSKAFENGILPPNTSKAKVTVYRRLRYPSLEEGRYDAEILSAANHIHGRQD